MSPSKMCYNVMSEFKKYLWEQTNTVTELENKIKSLETELKEQKKNKLKG